MSSRHYGLSTYGLHLNINDLIDIYEKYYEKEVTGLSPYDLMWELYEDSVIEYESEFTGEAFGPDKDGNPEWCDTLEYYNCEPLVYVSLAYQPSLTKKPYRDLDEAVEELRNAMDGLLPDNFDYRKQLCLICGTYYG